MHPKDTINNFIIKFWKAMKAVNDLSDKENPPPTDFYLSNLFLRKCLQVAPVGSDLRKSLLDYHQIIKRSKNSKDFPYTLADIEQDLGQQECNLKQPAKPSVYRREHANNTKIKTKFKGSIRCYYCGGNHRLSECKKCSQEEKKKLWEKHSSKNRSPKKFYPKKQSAHATKQKDSNQANKESQKSTKYISDQANSTFTVKSPKPKLRVNFASLAQVLVPHHHAHSAHPQKYKGNEPDSKKISYLNQWLIDSGCSNHMTPFLDDIIQDSEPSEAVIEVANGNIVKATISGTVLLRIIDIEDNTP